MARQANKARERRRYYRIDDVVRLEYRVLSEEESAALGRGAAPTKPPGEGLMEQITALTKHMTPLLSEIRKTSPVLARYLNQLNKKVDLLATHIALESSARFRADAESEAGPRHVNLSAGGVAFAVPRCLPKGRYLHIRLGVEETGFLLNTYGRVIDCRPREGRDDYEVRVEFPFLDEQERGLLVRHIFQRQRALIRERKKGVG